MEALATLNNQRQFDFQNNGIEVMDLETLQRTYKENDIYGNHTLGWGSEKKNHSYIYDFTIYDFTIEVTSLSIFIFSSWGQRYVKSVGRRKKGKQKTHAILLVCVFCSVS